MFRVGSKTPLNINQESNFYYLRAKNYKGAIKNHAIHHDFCLPFISRDENDLLLSDQNKSFLFVNKIKRELKLFF